MLQWVKGKILQLVKIWYLISKIKNRVLRIQRHRTGAHKGLIFMNENIKQVLRGLKVKVS